MSNANPAALQTGAMVLRDRFKGLTLSKTALKFGENLTEEEINQVNPKDVEFIRTNFVPYLTATDEEVALVLNLLEFNGFDPKMMDRHCAAIMLKHDMDVNTTKQELLLLLGIHHQKGNITEKNISGFSPEGQTLVKELIAKWQVQSKVGERKKDAFTLPRIGAAYPYLLSVIAAVGNKDYAGFCDSSELPSCMKTSSFSSLIPQSCKVTQLLLDAYNSYATDQGVVLTKRDVIALKDEDKKKLYSEQYKYSKQGFDSTRVLSDNRKASMYKLSLGTAEVYQKLKGCVKWADKTSDVYCSEQEYLVDFITFQACAQKNRSRMAMSSSGGKMKFKKVVAQSAIPPVGSAVGSSTMPGTGVAVQPSAGASGSTQPAAIQTPSQPAPIQPVIAPGTASPSPMAPIQPAAAPDAQPVAQVETLDEDDI